MKKKMLVSIFSSVFLIFGLGVSSVGATPLTPGQTDVTGTVTKSGVPVPGAHVNVLCDGNTKVDTTNASGDYLVVYPIAKCKVGDTVTVSASKGGDSGVTTGVVTGVTTKLNLAIVDVSIPEFGLIGAVAAGGLGVGAIAFSRRRQQRQS